MADAPPDALREFTASRLPTYRHADVVRSPGGVEANGPTVLPQPVDYALSPSGEHNDISRAHITSPPQHARTRSVNQLPTSTSPSPSHRDSSLTSPKLARHLTFPADFSTQQGAPRSNALPPQTPSSQKTRRNPPAATLRKDNNGPPLSMITQGHYGALSPTTDWVAQQSKSINSPPIANTQNELPLSNPSAGKSSRPTSTLIKPIRGFKPSSRRQSDEMASRRSSQDADNTLRVGGGHNKSYSHGTIQIDHEEQNSDESDLFLRAAKEEEHLSRQPTITNEESPSRMGSRRSRIGQRGSDTLFNSGLSHRRGSDNEVTNDLNTMPEPENIGQALTYHPSARDRPSALDDVNKTRYYGGNTRSTPTTPRGLSSREVSPPESQVSYGGRRPSVPDTTLPPARSTYRASNLSYTTPRVYNSSPLVSRTTKSNETVETPRVVEGTESTVSTTAPSTVWDELDDLKSRIHRLELTGKLPATSGAAMTRASNERPPTATTTVTTMSSSPKRGRANSISPIEQIGVDPATNEAHPNLQAALAKSKTLLSDEIYKALEAATSDALAISVMMGSSGQPGPISSSQSVIGGAGSVTDRQVRRKANSLCQSLTELCLALTEGKTDSQATLRPASRDTELRTAPEPINTQRQVANTDLARVKASPRALSRLEARRSSLLATSTMPSPRYNPSESATPTQSLVTGRRTSLLLRSRRGATEEPEEDDDESRFRAPSRAVTEVHPLRNSPREYTSQQPLPERQPSIQSSLPVRRHYASNSLTNTAPTTTPPISSLSGRRYLDRSTPERDVNNLTGRLADDRVQRKASLSQTLGLGRTGSLTRRTRQPSSADYSITGQKSRY